MERLHPGDRWLARTGPARALCAAAALCALLLAAPAPARALPPSLRSEQDVRDLVEHAMRELNRGASGAAYRLLARHGLEGPDAAAARITQGERRAAGRRARIGLPLGWEALDVERAGAHLLRLVYLERFDRGVVLRRFVFYRPGEVWLFAAADEIEDWNAAFGDPVLPLPVDAADGAAPAGEAAPAPEAPAPPAPPPTPPAARSP